MNDMAILHTKPFIIFCICKDVISGVEFEMYAFLLQENPSGKAIACTAYIIAFIKSFLTTN